MQMSPVDTAVVFIDPQNEVLSAKGLAWPCVGERRKRMAPVFGEASTTDEVLSGVNLQGKRVLVTGVSAGLGVETARALAAHGAQVVGTARDRHKADVAADAVRKDAAAHGGSFDVVVLDLASLKSVRACAEGLLKQGEPFDVIINQWC
jgi:D-arabinose 1-dehydrogenase-like Zn-dependent alcohol dehydrogenase